MKARPNLTLAKLVTETYIESADSSTDLVYFTKDAHEKLNDFYSTGLFQDSDADKVKTHEMVDIHLFCALAKKLDIKVQ